MDYDGKIVTGETVVDDDCWGCCLDYVLDCQNLDWSDLSCCDCVVEREEEECQTDQNRECDQCRQVGHQGQDRERYRIQDGHHVQSDFRHRTSQLRRTKIDEDNNG